MTERTRHLESCKPLHDQTGKGTFPQSSGSASDMPTVVRQTPRVKPLWNRKTDCRIPSNHATDPSRCTLKESLTSLVGTCDWLIAHRFWCRHLHMSIPRNGRSGSLPAPYPTNGYSIFCNATPTFKLGYLVRTATRPPSPRSSGHNPPKPQPNLSYDTIS